MINITVIDAVGERKLLVKDKLVAPPKAMRMQTPFIIELN